MVVAVVPLLVEVVVAGRSAIATITQLVLVALFLNSVVRLEVASADVELPPTKPSLKIGVTKLIVAVH